MVLISILNWNTAAVTLDCVRSLSNLRCEGTAKVEIMVIDNGSADPDFQALQQGLHGQQVVLKREAVNHGFAGGHNIAISHAIAQGIPYVWLLNSDSLVQDPETLNKLLAHLQSRERCGVVSPVIGNMGANDRIQFCGAYTDWANSATVWMNREESARRHADSAAGLWVVGTATLYRVAALKEVGLLDHSMFAYFEDNEICARLARHGWTSEVALDAKVVHAALEGLANRKPYFYYLMARNGMKFWTEYTPPGARPWLRLKLLDEALFKANRLYQQGLPKHGDAAVLGIYDFYTRKFGPPQLERPVPLIMGLLQKLVRLTQRRALARPPSTEIAAK